MVSTSANLEDGYGIQFVESSQQFTISGHPNRFWHVTISDAMGRILFVERIEDSVLSNPLELPTGIYFIHATDGHSILVQKCYLP
jgi:hypothetical protein